MRKLMFILVILISIPILANARPVVDIYVTSQCQHGTRAENILYLIKSRIPNLEINVHYLVFKDDYDEFFTMQGENELEEDKRQLVIREFFPDRYWDYLMSRNTHFSDTFWHKDAAIAYVDIDTLKVRIKREGRRLLKKEAQLTDSLKLDSSPTFFINGVKMQYWDGTYSSLFMLLNVRTANYNLPPCFDDSDCHPASEGKVSRCKNYNCVESDPVKINLDIIGFEPQSDPEVEYMVDIFKSYFIGLKVNFVKHDSPKAQKYIELFSLTTLPAFIFSQNTNQSVSYIRLKDKLLTQVDGKDTLYLADPKTIRATYLLNRELHPGELTVFTMSECPYGTMAENDLYHYAKKNADKVKLRFVLSWNEEKGEFSSLHGESEINADRRQSVIQEFFPNEKLWDYLHCVNNVEVGRFGTAGVVDSCLKAVGIDPDSLAALVAEYGDSLLKVDAAMCKDYNINSSPTFLWENRAIMDRNQIFELLHIKPSN